MSVKKITEANMRHLRKVLQGDNKTAMWASLNSMKLSPKDQVSIQKCLVIAALEGCEMTCEVKFVQDS